ncbi:hypothetical protein TSUD_358530 [Trifolium subterraneum]|uniref:RING-type domain-containing protein n=1 Tax=Trifolium subterraneum TaxID=3900 RepID=A0A2Z6NSK6_TRISU|nr:hypothetical protein TSUD_358530 [Trifolium subterraneum]
MAATCWCITFVIFALLIPVSFVTHLTGRLIYLACVVGLAILFLAIKFYKAEIITKNNANDFELPGLYLRRGEDSARRRTEIEIGTWAMGLLPPAKSVESDEDMRQCPICMEEYTRGESIQTFGVCDHDFHRSCLHSWLQRGKSSCSVCRLDLFV